MPGGVFLWNGARPDDAPAWDRTVIGAVMLVLGILFFVYFPRLVKRPTGREVFSSYP